jgi:hypothetical protein
VKDKPTEKQAQALIEVMVGWEPVVEGEGRRKSPLVAACLEGALGLDQIPGGAHWFQKPSLAEGPLCTGFLDHLQGCVDALRPEGYGTCATCESQPIKDQPCVRVSANLTDFGCRGYVARKSGEGQ